MKFEEWVKSGEVQQRWKQNSIFLPCHLSMHAEKRLGYNVKEYCLVLCLLSYYFYKVSESMWFADKIRFFYVCDFDFCFKFYI